MPIGPTDPDAVVAAIKGGATWQSNHLVDGATSKWLHVDTVANAWTLVTSAEVLIDEDTHRDLLNCETTAGNLIKVGGVRKQLLAVTISGSTWAALADP